MSRPLVGVLLACAALTAACSGTTPGTAVGADPTVNRPSATSAESRTATVSADPPGGKSCAYRTKGTSAGKDVGLPPRTSDDTQAAVTLKTSQGDIAIALATAKAPCTTRSFAFLAEKGFWDGSPCHRLTTEGIMVLQCGDPTGSGTGGPGYVIPDENPTDLPEGTGGGVVYPRGTVAMANAGPGTGGSQFFLVYADSPLTPDYAVIGELDDSSLDVVDKVARGGSEPDGDGKPKTPVEIVSTKVN